ncbi:hypothetical protein [Bradyrhizobium sp. 149]|nr:hypothetical protein [Bradyrhizobium sp. 149]
MNQTMGVQISNSTAAISSSRHRPQLAADDAEHHPEDETDQRDH